MINKARAKMGRIKHWYGGKKGYGFVRPEDGGEAVFVHHTCMAPHAGPEYLEEGGPSKLRSSLEEDVRSVGEERSHH